MAGDGRSEELKLLQEIARWTREAALPNLRKRVESVLDNDSKKRVYEAMEDGTATIKAIESMSGANHNDIRAWLNVWEAEGIADAGASPPKATFTLRELGVSSPPPKASRKAAK